MKSKLPLLIISALLLGACTHNKADVAPTTDTNTAVPAPESNDIQNTTIPESHSAIKEISMTAKQWEFTPSTITVSQGDTVRLTITSTDVDHGFAIPQYNINQQLSPGEATVVEFVANKVGEFRFSCSVLCGSGHGSMKGTLIVQ